MGRRFLDGSRLIKSHNRPVGGGNVPVLPRICWRCHKRSDSKHKPVVLKMLQQYRVLFLSLLIDYVWIERERENCSWGWGETSVLYAYQLPAKSMTPNK